MALALSAGVAVRRFRRLGCARAKHHAHAQPAHRPVPRSRRHQSEHAHRVSMPTVWRQSRESTSVGDPRRRRDQASRRRHATAAGADRIGVRVRRFPMRAIRTISIRLATTPIAAPTANVLIVPLSRRRRRQRRLGQKGQWRRAQQRGAGRVNLRSVRNEFVAEIDGALSTAQADELARRHGLERLAVAEFSAARRSTIGLFRIIDRRRPTWCAVNLPPMAASSRCSSISATCCRIRKSTPTEGDPAQYALAQLRLPQAHALARGMNVTIAVIDSGIDANHPELANSIADSFDALGSKEGPHVHGTGIAGAIVAHARLMGSAPEARILAIRAFGAAASGAESTLLRDPEGLDYAALHGAQIINMSFAGPKDPLIERARRRDRRAGVS